MILLELRIADSKRGDKIGISGGRIEPWFFRVALKPKKQVHFKGAGYSLSIFITLGFHHFISFAKGYV
jgi:hypothetical protein